MADYQILASGGVRRTADDLLIPNDAENLQWQEYQAWVTGGGVADPAFAPTLPDHQAGAKRGIDEEAERRLQAQAPQGASGLGLANAALVDEARRIEGVGSPVGADYPLLNELVTATVYVDLATAGTQIRAWWSGRVAAIGAIEAVRRQAHIDIDAAGSISAVDTVVGGVTWP